MGNVDYQNVTKILFPLFIFHNNSLTLGVGKEEEQLKQSLLATEDVNGYCHFGKSFETGY
jgi:hypothetical protein